MSLSFSILLVIRDFIDVPIFQHFRDAMMDLLYQCWNRTRFFDVTSKRVFFKLIESIIHPCCLSYVWPPLHHSRSFTSVCCVEYVSSHFRINLIISFSILDIMRHIFSYFINFDENEIVVYLQSEQYQYMSCYRNVNVNLLALHSQYLLKLPSVFQ